MNRDKANPKYEPQKIEPKWQQKWEEEGVYKPDMDKAKKPFYNLMMFPYPSAEGMHVGNMYAFTGSDVYGRFKRMQGFDVFEPIGLDGFGIHSENYALKIGRHPMEQAETSEKNFYRQLHATGNGFDWSRTVETYDPEYYKWTQWIFTKLFQAGLAYRKKAPVNFCPSCKTVLADEQVIKKETSEGTINVCERCSTQVEKKELEQWFFRITKYAERLLQNIPGLNWSEKVKIAQREWIGRKIGINIKYQISSIRQAQDKYQIECFTTRPDTNFGATFVVIAPEHPFVAMLLKIKNHPFDKLRAKIKNEIRTYVEKAKKKSQQERMAEGREKTGVFTGLYCVNSLNNYKMPLYISDFVLMEFGTGAVVGVPGHDIRDFEFAQKFKLPIIRVVVGKNGDMSPITKKEQVQEENGTMINSEFLNGMEIHEATKKIIDYLEEKGWGRKVTIYHLRDWLISRQRYWGAPIPMIYCEKCAKAASQGEALRGWDSAGWYPVQEKDLPVKLPKIEDYKPLGTGKSPLANHPDFYEVNCPVCGAKARRETDVSDTFLDSAWYFLRYTSTDIKNKVFDLERVKKWLPVTMYIGGAEHSVLHLLYSRFITMVFKDLGLIEFEEPYARFYAHGLLIKEGAKMSKSKGNVVIPDEYIKKYGADTLRTYLMFLGPFNQGGDFYDSGIEGIHKFLKRVWVLVQKELKSQNSKVKITIQNSKLKDEENTLNRIMHKTIKKVTEDLEALRYNTAIAALMEYYNALSALYTKYEISASRGELNTIYCKTLVLLLSPFAPHMTEELWQKFQLSGFSSQLSDNSQPVVSQSVTDKLKTEKLKSENRKPKTDNWSIHNQPWPSFNPQMLQEEEVIIVVQVNGKVRDTIKVQSSKFPTSPRLRGAGKVQSYVERIAKKSEKVRKYLEGKRIVKVVYVEGKIINFVVE